MAQKNITIFYKSKTNALFINKFVSKSTYDEGIETSYFIVAAQ